MKNKHILFLMMILTAGILQAQVNDSCINAIPLTVGYSCAMDTFSSVGATAETGVAPNPTCGFYKGGDVWFTAVMPASGALRYEIAGISGINPQTAIYTGSCGAMTQILCLQLDGNKTLIDTSLAGETLYFRIFNYNNATGGLFRLCVWEPPVPVNDNCDDAIVLDMGDSCVFAGFTNAYASGEPLSVAPNPSCGFYAGGDVWFTSTMPASGALRIQITQAQAAVYHGTCGAFTEISCLQLDPDRTILRPDLGGEPIYIRAYSYNNEDGGPFTICLWEPPIPPNNDCADAIPLPVGDSCEPQTFTNAYATAQPTSVAPNPTCGFYAGGDVWFTFTMPASGALRIEANPIQIALYKGTCGAMTQVTCIQLDNERTFVDTSLAGETLYIRAFSFSNEEGVPFNICLWEPPIPPNDQCENAIPVQVSTNCAMLPYTNAYATAQPVSVAPNPTCGFYGGGDVWFTATMPNTGKMIINRQNQSGFSIQWAVYTGGCGNMTQIACAQLMNSQQIDNASLAGSTLYIRFFSYGNDEGGPFSFCVFDTTCNDVGTFIYYDTICSGEAYTFADGSTLAGITESLTDTAYLVNELFCDSLVITHLHVRPLMPALNLPSQIALPCETFSMQLDAGSGYDSYHWSTGQHSQVINVTQPGLYIVSVTGCFEGPASDSSLVTLPQPSVSGTLRYLNQAQTPLPDRKIYLMTAGNTPVDSTLTDPNGAYRFCSMPPGTYSLSVHTSDESGGINSIDALLILQHFTGLQYLTGLRLLAADVNASNYVNASDALLVQRHFVELITTFPAGDWIFDEPTVTIGPEDAPVINLYGLCFGDVNGSFSP